MNTIRVKRRSDNTLVIDTSEVEGTLSFTVTRRRVIDVASLGLSADQLVGSQALSIPAFGQDLVLLTDSGVLVNVGQVIEVSWEDGSGRNYLVRTQKLHQVYPDRDRFWFRLALGVSGPMMRN